MKRNYSGPNYYSGNLAREKRRRFFVIFILSVLAVTTFIIFGIYAVFYAPWLKITEININGLETIDPTKILGISESIKNEKFIIDGLRPGTNIMFFGGDELKKRAKKEFPVIKELTVTKEYPHKITINVTERHPVGTWCRPSDCRYFDDSGTLWGKALRSSGSLLLTVDDMRDSDRTEKIENEYLEPVKKINDGLASINIKLNRIEIPPGKIGDIKIYTVSGYYLLLNNSSDIPGQLKILGILLEQKGDNFKPEYIDLRIDGRIYYK